MVIDSLKLEASSNTTMIDLNVFSTSSKDAKIQLLIQFLHGKVVIAWVNIHPFAPLNQVEEICFKINKL